MWTITGQEVIHIGRSPGGDRFTLFVDSILRTYSFGQAIPNASIHTTVRTNKQDGGVDTQIDVAAQNDSTDWMGAKTIWQYKATDAGNIRDKDLRDEINAWYAKECLQTGSAYRFCICDDIAASKQQEWEQKLTQYAREINPEAPEAKVLTASDLADWANTFPSLILRFFLSQFAGIANHLGAWRDNITDATKQYVPVPAWEPVHVQIREHIKPEIKLSSVVLSVQGEAGVGKTRMVYEALAGVPSIENLVLYTDDEQSAQQVARLLANEKSRKAILVADECSVGTRVQLENLLRGHRDRIRMIAIDNSGERPPSGAPEYWIQKIPEAILEAILQENFPFVPAERRRAYAHLAQGFVRLAADMCNWDSDIAREGHLGPVLPTIQDYFHTRFAQDIDRSVVEALALMTRVGFKDEVADELDLLCSLVGLDRQQIQSIVHRLHDVPGFVARAGRFFYVTPEIIAQVAFEGAWRRWAEPDPEQFLQRIPDRLLESFLTRVARSAPQEVHALVGEFFRRWANQLRPEHLVVITEVDRLIVLIEIDPDTYLPILQRLIEQADQEQLLGVTGTGGNGRWGPRRELVWIAERMARFPEYFSAVEHILLRLALAETEPGIVNNATGVWWQLFVIVFSGTAVPFLERLSRLEERICSEDEPTSELALNAFSHVFDAEVVGRIGPPVVAGRIPPEQWHPQTSEEYKQCLDAAVSLLVRLARSDSQRLQEKGHEIAIKTMHRLLSWGYLNELRDVLDRSILTDKTYVRVVTALEEFLYLDALPGTREQRLSEDYLAEIRHWLESLKPADLHGKLIAAVCSSYWDHALIKEEEAWHRELHTLALQLYQQQEHLAQELPWLCSENARSAVVFGEELGKLDAQGALLDLMLETVLQYPSPALARGYIFGLLETSFAQWDRLNAQLDKIEKENPKLAYELFMAGGKATNSLQRTLRLIDAGQLSATYLQGFVFGDRFQKLTAEDFAQALQRFLDAIAAGDTRMFSVAVQLVGRSVLGDRKHGVASMLDDATVQSLLWRLMENTPQDSRGNDSYWSERILTALLPVNPDKVARIAARVLVSQRFPLHTEVTNLLMRMASEYPDVVMQRLGEVILDDEQGWMFAIGNYKVLLQALPTDTVIQWLRSNGLEAARRLARHLPNPYLGENGEPIVPRLTEYVLATFEDDDLVFSGFLAETHSLQVYSRNIAEQREVVDGTLPQNRSIRIRNIAAQHEAEIQVAMKFLHHPLRRIREWAQAELEAAHYHAKRERQRAEEESIV